MDETKMTLEELMQSKLGFAAYSDDYIYVTPLSDDEYDNSVYQIDRKTKEVKWMFYTSYICSGDNYNSVALPFEELSSIWKYL